MFRKENGVTLVALVITIIVLLILAGVTISMVMGDNGILGYAEQAGEDYPIEEMKSAVTLAVTTANTKALAAKYDNNTTTTSAAVTASDVSTELSKMGITLTFTDNVATYTAGDKTLTITITPGTASSVTASVAFS